MHDTIQALFRHAHLGLVSVDDGGCILRASPGFCTIVGRPEADVVGRAFEELTHPEDRDAEREQIAALMSGEVDGFTTDRRYVRPDGEVRHVHVDVVRMDDDGPVRTAAVVHDLTEQQALEADRARTAELLRLSQDIAGVGAWSLDTATGRQTWTQAIFDIFEAPAGPPPPLDDVLARYPEPWRGQLEEALERARTHGERFDLDLEVITFTGRRLRVRAVGEARTGADGEVDRLVGAFQDVTALRLATEEARETATRLVTALESMTDAIFLVDHEWRFTYLNTRAEELLQRARQELLGTNFWQQFPEAVGTDADVAYHRAMATGETEELDEYFYPPLDTWFAVRAYPSPDGLAVYFRDVTWDRRTRHELRARATKLAEQAALLDETVDAIVVCSLDDRVTFWNRGAERLYGWSAAHAVGRPLGELVGGDTDQVPHQRSTVVEAGRWTGEVTRTTRQGDEVHVDVRASLLREPDGTPRAMMCVDTDVTDRRRMEAHLLRSQRLQSLGTLASGIAHDLNNVLAPILMGLDLLDEAGPAEREDIIGALASSTRRGSELVQQVLAFARGYEGDRVAVDVGEVVDEVVRIARKTFPRNIDVRVVVAEDLPTTSGDPTQLHQVVMNVLVNARDALPDGGTVRVTVTQATLDDAYVAHTADASPGRHVVVSVEDDGVGMAPAVADRAFEPFFTTKPSGEGTGLGLSTSLGIVSSLGGHVRLYSERGRGTTCHVYLPAATREEPALQPVRTEQDVASGRGELVLVVDDEEAIRLVADRILRAAGYDVLVASDGAEAVALLAGRLDDVDLVVTDLMMPIMDGNATVRAVRSMAPDLPIIATSGLEAHHRLAETIDIQGFLPKPYARQTLLQVIREVLDGRRPLTRD